jgi:outer membrane biosynthesis protein TonB/pSer/pThr/pTyr-binding forkhead associated (FHA) protein
MAPEQNTPGFKSKTSGGSQGKGTAGAFNHTQVIVLKYAPSADKPQGKVFKLNKKRIVIGSVISADVRLTGDGVAPIHAVLEVTLDAATGLYSGSIFDLASDTGVFVNNKKIVTQKLKNSDELVIGKHRLKYSLEDLQDSQNKSDRTREIEGRTLFLNPKEDLAPLLLQDEREVEEIFDYRPTSKRALEVVMSWCGAILSVEHFVKEKSVTVGSTLKSNFGIPPLLSSGQYAIVTRTGDGFVLNLDAKMKGVIHKSGELLSLEDFRKSGGTQAPIGNEDFAKVSIGDIDFYFSFTSAPPRLKRRKIFQRDPFFSRVFFSSILLTAILLFALTKVTIPPNIEAEQLPDRIATILYQPEKFMTPPVVPVSTPAPTPAPVKPTPAPKVVEPPTPAPKPKPKPTVKITVAPKPVPAKAPIPKVMDVAPAPKKALEPTKVTPPAAKAAKAPHAAPKASAKEGEGAKAKGASGSRGEPDKKKSAAKVTELSRPSPTQGDKGASGVSQVPDEGNVDILKGAGGRIQNILGNSAAHLGKGSESLKGFGNFSTGGSGGLALSGSGGGGGGTAETTLGGLGKKGTGMGRVGTGKGAAGEGNGIVGSQLHVTIRTDGPEEAVVMGSIDRDAIAAAIYAHKDEFRLCYEREINAENPKLTGQIGTSFTIGSSGRVTHAGIESSSLKNPNAERCVIGVLKRIDFPIPRGGGVVEVHFPFKFSAVGQS